MSESSQRLAIKFMLGGYNIMEIWTIKQCDKNRLRTAEMKYLRRTAGYTLLNHKRYEEILEELDDMTAETETGHPGLNS
jgi:hypothetical protein